MFSVKFTASNSVVIEDVGEESCDNKDEASDVNAKTDTPKEQSTEDEHVDIDASELKEPTFLTVTAQLVNHNEGLGFQVSGFENYSLSNDEIESVKQIARDELLSNQVDCSKRGEEPPTSLTVKIPLPLKKPSKDNQPSNDGEFLFNFNPICGAVTSIVLGRLKELGISNLDKMKEAKL